MSSTSNQLDFNYGSKDVQDFVSLYSTGSLNLEPGFQRNSVWTENDRKKLILSLLQHYPIPSVFLYRRVGENGRLVYDVLDGKQRLESILMFMSIGSFRNERFAVKHRFAEMEDYRVWNWKSLKRARYEHLISGYKIQTVEVSGELSDIIDLFVRINSTGKRLTGQEKRHARFFHSPFLKEAGRLGDRFYQYFDDNRILSKGLLSRMKHVELICELMTSIHTGQVMNKKSALDKIIAGDTINRQALLKCKLEFVRSINLLKKVFPNLKSTRFRNSAEFYSLFMMIWNFDKERLILSKRSRNKQAEKLLEWLSDGVDNLRQQISKGKGAKPDQQLFASYLFTTRGDSDSSTTRHRRAEVLKQLFQGLFERKDEKRGFGLEQRRLIWNSDSAKNCTTCGTKLTWENFTIDHIKPYSLGGKSTLKNATLMCRSCNSRKGKNRIRKRA